MEKQPPAWPLFPELRDLAAQKSPAVSVPKFAALTGLTEEAVRDGIRDGDLPGRKVGGRFHIPRVAAYRYLCGEWPSRRPPRRIKVERVTRRIDAYRYLRAYRR